MIKVELNSVDDYEIGNAQIEVHGNMEVIANEVLAVMCWFYDNNPVVFQQVSEHFKEHVYENL